MRKGARAKTMNLKIDLGNRFKSKQSTKIDEGFDLQTCTLY